MPRALTALARCWRERPPLPAELASLAEHARERPEALLETARLMAEETGRTGSNGRPLARCAIVSVRSGGCGEDCAFCAQASRHPSRPEYRTPGPFLSPEAVADAARRAREAGASRLGLVASGRAFRQADLPRWEAAIAAVTAQGLLCDVSPGLVDPATLRRLMDAGYSGLHHNLESSRSFFPSLCASHSWDARRACVAEAMAAGCWVCSGGIFGCGETWEDRLDLALTLRELGVPSVPMNFLHPIPGTPLGHRSPLAAQEALGVLACFRLLLPEATLRLCGGRQLALPRLEDRLAALALGVDGVMVGDFLTTAGGQDEEDRRAESLAGRVPPGQPSEIPSL